MTSQPPPRRLRLRYAGRCVACEGEVPKGTEAWYDASAKTVRCLACVAAAADALPLDEGAAGGSAQSEYGRRVAKRDTEVRDRWGGGLGGAILALTHEPASTRSWARGAEGERALADALAGIEGLRVLHDRRVLGTRGNIDHLAIAPAGVFVIDAKRYSGKIRIRHATGMSWQVDAVRAALERGRIDPMPPITPVLCFVRGEWPLLFPPEAYAGVRLEGTRSIRSLVMKPPVLTSTEVDGLARFLQLALPAKRAAGGE